MNNIKHISISSKNDKDIRSILNELLINLKNIEINYDECFKIILLGDSSSGKKELYNIIKYEIFSYKIDNLPSYDIDILYKRINLKSGKEIMLQIWDTAGQERFSGISKNYYRASDCIFLIFDVTNRNSYDKVKIWNNQIIDRDENKKPIYLIGNLIDLTNERLISKEVALKYANKYKIKYFEICHKDYKDDIAIKELMIDLINESIKKERRKAGFKNI